MAMRQWHYVKLGQRLGPVSAEALAALEAGGSIDAETLVWTEGMADWKPLRTQRRRLPSSKAAPSGGGLLSQALAMTNAVGEDGGLVYGNFWERLGARVIDFLIVQAASTAVGLLGHLLERDELNRLLFSLVLALAIAAAYEIHLTAAYGATVGKMAMKLRVRNPDGSAVDLATSVRRYLATFLSGLTCLVGYLIMIGDPQGRTLHDRLAHTVVLRAR
jgi:uncharacterized RDD family membrane protein YckC